MPYLLIFIFTILTSCIASKVTRDQIFTIHDSNYINAIGDTVSEMSNDLMIIYQDTKGMYWFGSNGDGVYRYNPDEKIRVSGKNIIHFSKRHGLSNDSICAIQEDKAGNIYLTTLDGICKYDGKIITQLTPVKSNEWKLTRDDLWFTGNQWKNGVYRYDGHTLYDLKFPRHEMEDELFQRTGPVPFDVNVAYIIYKNSKGNVLFGTSSFGVCIFDGTSFSWISDDEMTFRKDAFGVRGILEDKDGKYWLSNSIHRYNIDIHKSPDGGQSIMTYSKEKGIQQGLGEYSYFMSIAEDRSGDLWMLTYSGGVWRYDGENITHYPIMEDGKMVYLFTIYKDLQGDLWLGTHEHGVYKFNGNKFEKFRP
ncbi:MAG: hypothetical protein M3R25_12335 [Bacteroidota bacterium]|nr:hypothetical protein [Bacteroidota bacterium]